MRERTVHTLFLISVWTKGIAGLLETLAGILIFVSNPTVIHSLVISLTAPELAEDPDDWIATTLRHAVVHISGNTALFAAAYLSIHGLIKVFLAVGLLKDKLWAYPLSLWLLGFFIIYQCYRFAHTYSALLILITIFDCAVAYLIWREYRFVKTRTM